MATQTGFVYLGILSPRKAYANIQPEIQGSVSLKRGWNLISPSDEVLPSDYLSGCTISSGPWEWNPQIFKYQKAHTLKPMHAYWVKINEDCELDVGSTGEGNAQAKSTQLKAGWNLVASTSNYNWNQFKGNCVLEINWLFSATGSNYSMISPRANLEPFRGYWVKVKSACTITEPVSMFNVSDLVNINPVFNCYLSQGAPADSCDPAQVIEKNGKEYCRHFNASCSKNDSGYYQWGCNYSEDPKPASNYICTDTGWQKQPSKESDQSWLKLDLCNLTGSLLSSLLGHFASEFSGEVIVGIFGEDVAKKVQGLVGFYFWLQAHGFDPQALASGDPQAFAEQLNIFIAGGVNALQGLAADAVRNFIYSFAVEMKIDPGLAQELGNFAAFLAKKGISMTAEGSQPPQDIGKFLQEYVAENSSPLIEKIVRAEQVLNLIKVGFDIEGSVDNSQVLQAINSITNNALEKIKQQTNLSDSDINNILGFIRFLVQNKNLTLQVILQQNKDQMLTLWQSYAQSHNITLQKGIETIQTAVYSLAAEAANQLLQTFKIDTQVNGETVQKALDSQLVQKTTAFLNYLLFDKGFDFSQISLEIEGDNFSVLLSEAGIDIDVDSQAFLKKAVEFVSDKLNTILQENFNINPELAKYVIDFINYTVNAQGQGLDVFLSFNLDDFMASFNSYVNARGKQILIQITVDFVSPYINQALEKFGADIDPQLLAEIGSFAKFLSETKNLSLENVGNYAKDRVAELISEFAAKQVSKLTGIRYDILQKIFRIVIQENLIQDTVHLDLQTIIKKLIINVEINGNFACPTDLTSAVCTLLNGNNWESCSTGSLPIVNASPPQSSQPHTVNLYDPNVKPASLAICSVPNIYISILGQPIIQGINLKVGPIAYRGTKLRLDMPTSNKIDWGDGSKKDSLYKAYQGDGLYHTYSSAGTKNVSAHCRFLLNIDVGGCANGSPWGFHWPTVPSCPSKSINVN